MKHRFTTIATLLLTLLVLPATAQYHRHFHDKALRVDYLHCGDARHEAFYLHALIEQPHWAGSRVNLVDTSGMGNYHLNLYDPATDSLLYSTGFSTLFWEWRSTEEARHTPRGCVETLLIPYPRHAVRLQITARDRRGRHVPCFQLDINPDDPFIQQDHHTPYPTREILYSGDPATHVDILLLPDGYTADEMPLFLDHCRAFVEGLFSFSPYKERRSAFNVRAVLAPSLDSGVDLPVEHAWRRTALNTAFYTFNSERYLMTFDNPAIHDLAANAPHDLIYIIANTQKYGGGAIYNHYGISVSGNIHAAKVYVHEFCHLFAGLGDEYEGDVSYNDLYPTDVEPWEPNLTTLVRFRGKWADLIPAGTPVPTPLRDTSAHLTGLYEGGGYRTRGVYRSRPDCLMRTLQGDTFCPACTRAIIRRIEFYTR